MWFLILYNSFGDEHTPKEMEKFKGNKNIKTNIYRTETKDSVMFRYFFIGFIELMLKWKSLLDYTNLFSPNKYVKSDKIILKFFQ